jgi:hypothetical protein
MNALVKIRIAGIQPDEVEDGAGAWFEFKTDITAHCTGLPACVDRVFNRYLFKQGEATFCCAITPSSFGADLGAYCTIKPDVEMSEADWEAVWAWEEEAARGIDDSYFSFRAQDNANPSHSPLIDADNWAEAEEYANANPHFC